MNIPLAIKNARMRKGMKQYEAANKADITQTYLSQIEIGHKVPSFDVIEKLAKVYKTPFAIMLWYSIEEKDIPRHKINVYREMKPLMDSLIQNFI